MSVSTAIYLLEIDAWTGAGVETLYLATRNMTTGPSDNPANQVYLGRIIDAGKLSSGISIEGSASSSFGAIILNNQDGRLDAWFDYGFDGRAYRLKELSSPRSPVSGATLLVRGTIDGVDGSDALKTIRLKVRDRMADLDVPLLSNRYLGTTLSSGGGAEGGETLKGKVKRRIYGGARNIDGQRVNDFDLIDQWSDGPLFSITLYDGRLPLSNAGDVPTLAALQALSIGGGKFATCHALGLTKVGANAGFMLTADVIEGGTAASRSAVQVALRILGDAGFTDLDLASFAALDALNPAPVQIVAGDNLSVIDAVDQALSSIGGQAYATLTGQIAVAIISDPAAQIASDVYTQRDIAAGASFAVGAGLANSADAVPTWRCVLNFDRVWQTMSVSDLAPSITQAERDDLATEYRVATAEDATVRTAHLKADEVEQDTFLASRVDAEAEAARRLNLNKKRRDRLSVPLIEFIKGCRDLGSVVAVRTDRLGQRGGKKFVVVGRTFDFEKRVVTLDLWG